MLMSECVKRCGCVKKQKTDDARKKREGNTSACILAALLSYPGDWLRRDSPREIIRRQRHPLGAASAARRDIGVQLFELRPEFRHLWHQAK